MIIFSVLCILLGVFPELIYAYLPYETDYKAYSAGKVLFYLQLLLFSGLAFFLLLPLMKRTLTISLDADWLWRVLGKRIAIISVDGISRAGDAIAAKTQQSLQSLHRFSRQHLGRGPGQEQARYGLFARAWPIGTTGIWIAILLSAYVLVDFFF